MAQRKPRRGCPGCAKRDALIAERDAVIAKLDKRLGRLEREVADLRARVGQHSQNSHRPPSSDPPSAPPRPATKPTGRRPGGQPGHERHERRLVPVEEVDDLHVLRPAKCGQCGGRLRGADRAPVRHQVTDLPPVVPVVAEYQLHALTCGRCGTETRATLPAGVPSGAFGPRVQALTALFGGAYHLSKRAIQAVFADCFNLDLALGTVSKLEKATSALLAAPVAEAHAYVQQAPTVNADETGWWEKNRRAWLWVAATCLVAVFLIRRYRNRDSAQALLGARFRGILGSDRWASYAWVPLGRRQLCQAHLKRDYQKMVDAGGKAERVGTALLGYRKQVFTWWHRVRDGTLTRASMRTYVDRIRPEIRRWLRRGTRCGHAKTEGMCREILKEERALWTFVRVAGVEPTNNLAERCVRPAVLWRKRSFGTQSEAGSAFVERMLTTVTTLRFQGRHVLDYLTAACETALQGCAVPSLLPVPARARKRA